MRRTAAAPPVRWAPAIRMTAGKSQNRLGRRGSNQVQVQLNLGQSSGKRSHVGRAHLALSSTASPDTVPGLGRLLATAQRPGRRPTAPSGTPAPLTARPLSPAGTPRGHHGPPKPPARGRDGPPKPSHGPRWVTEAIPYGPLWVTEDPGRIAGRANAGHRTCIITAGRGCAGDTVSRS